MNMDDPYIFTPSGKLDDELRRAAREEHEEIVRSLPRHMPDRSEDPDGWTAIDQAEYERLRGTRLDPVEIQGMDRYERRGNEARHLWHGFADNFERERITIGEQ